MLNKNRASNRGGVRGAYRLLEVYFRGIIIRR